MRDWIGWIVGIAGAAWAVYERYRPKRTSLEYDIASELVIDRNRPGFESKLAVLYEDRPIKRLVRTSILIYNRGPHRINQGDQEHAILLRLPPNVTALGSDGAAIMNPTPTGAPEFAIWIGAMDPKQEPVTAGVLHDGDPDTHGGIRIGRGAFADIPGGLRRRFPNELSLSTGAKAVASSTGQFLLALTFGAGLIAVSINDAETDTASRIVAAVLGAGLVLWGVVAMVRNAGRIYHWWGERQKHRNALLPDAEVPTSVSPPPAGP